jgi:hypothetical protein
MSLGRDGHPASDVWAQAPARALDSSIALKLNIVFISMTHLESAQPRQILIDCFCCVKPGIPLTKASQKQKAPLSAATFALAAAS